MPIKSYIDPVLARLRKKFLELMENGKYAVGYDDWIKEVKLLLKSDNPTPEEWVIAAQSATTKCDRCKNGTYYWGTCINGRMQHSATCYRCSGKGRQNQEDYVRNRAYDKYVMSKVV